MADIDLSQLTDAQLGALKMVGGDLTKLPDKTLLDIKSTLSASQPGTLDKVAEKVNTGVNWLGTQFTKGITGVAGAPRMAADLQQRGAEWAGEKLGFPETGKTVGQVLRGTVPGAGLGPSTEEMNKGIFTDLGVPEVNAADNPALTLTNPLGLNGKVNLGSALDAGAQAVPSMMALPAGAAAATLSGPARAATTAIPAVTGGASGDLARQATAGTPYEIPASVLASVLGYMGGSKAVTPLPARLSPEQLRAVEIARETGTPLSVAQETGRGAKMESALARFPTSAGPFDRLAAKQGASTDTAALKEMGFAGDNTGTETMKAAKNQASSEFEAAKNMPGTVNLTPGFFGDVKGTLADYKANTSDAGIVPSVEKNVNALTKLEPGREPLPPLTATAVRSETPTLARLTQAIEDADRPLTEAAAGRNTGETLAAWFGEGPKVPMPKAPPELSNEQYQSFRKTVSDTVTDLYKGGKTDAARALQKVRDSLDDAAGASLPADQMEAWKTARRNYYNFKIIEKAAGAGTVASRSAGTLSPSALTQQLRKRQGDAFSSTTGGLNDVASLKQYLADTFPNSGTPTMQAWQGLLSGGAGLGAAGLTGAAGAGVLAPAVALPIAAAMAGPNMMARAMTGGGMISGPLRNYLANQAMVGARGPTPSGLASIPFSLAPGIAINAPNYPRLERR
jgi:hypothetical protein